MNEYKKLWIGAIIGCAFTVSTIILLIHVLSVVFYQVFINQNIPNVPIEIISWWYIIPFAITGIAYLAWEYKYGDWICGRTK